MAEVLIGDCETDGFLDALTKLHCIQIGTADGSDVTIYADRPGYASLAQGAERLSKAERVIFHNGIKFDFHAINRFFPGAVRREVLFDTLVAARLSDPEERQHSLEAWGLRLGILKGTYAGDFQTFDEELVRYARQDIVVGRALYHKVKHTEGWGESLQLEHDVAWAIAAQERNGFGFDVRAAQELDAVLRGELATMTDKLRDVFPPMWVRADKDEFTPKQDSRQFGYVAGATLTKVKLQAFNPVSRQQVGARLQKLGWKPKDFGKDGNPTVDEKVLSGLPYPEAKALVPLFEAQKKIGMLSDGKNAWLKCVKPDGRIYGAVNPNGAYTGRMTHFRPNVAQADKDPRMRALWIPRPGWSLVGCDAEGLEARMLAHYLARYDAGAFADRLLNGRKETGTDVHSANAKAILDAGYAVGREEAKTCLYALMYGAGDWKLGETVKQALRDAGLSVPGADSRRIGKRIRGALAQSMVGLDTLTDDLKATAKARGYIRGLDGRHVKVRSPHAILNTLCQGAGGVVMKKALAIFMGNNCIRAEEYGNKWALCGNIHDEIQLESVPDISADLGAALANCIRVAGEHFNLRCPLAGAYAVGTSWRQTH